MMSRFAAALFYASLFTQGSAAEMRTPPFAIYYSFDQTPSIALLAEMKAEFLRITEPAGLSVEWREIGSESGEYANIFVVRFHGSCSAESPGKEPALAADERSLAETSIADGHVLPFANVQCDLLRRYLNPAMRGRPDAAAVLARAIARVTAHELYHMMTGSASHGRRGVSQAVYSFEDLVGPHFAFGSSESEWLRARLAPWPERRSI